MWVTDGLRDVRNLEGRRVSVALTDGTRIDDCQLVSAGREGTTTLWLYSGQDMLVSHDQVIDVWESPPAGFRAA